MIIEDDQFQGVSITLAFYFVPKLNALQFQPSLPILSPSILPLHLSLIPSLPIPTHAQPSHFGSTYTKIEMIQRLADYRD